MSTTSPPSFKTPMPPAEAPPSTLAITSLVCGILGWIMVLPVIGSLIAIITGHLARKEIATSQGRIGGKGMATAGLVLGYSFVVIVALVVFVAGMVLLFIVGAASHMNDEVDSVKRALDELPASATVSEKVIAIVSEQLGFPTMDVQLESIFEDLGADELDLVEIVMEVEEAFDITLPDEEVENVKTVQDLVHLIESKLEAAQAGAIGPAMEGLPSAGPKGP